MIIIHHVSGHSSRRWTPSKRQSMQQHFKYLRGALQKDTIGSDLCLRSIKPEELRNFEELHRGDPMKVFYHFRCKSEEMIFPQGSVSYEWMEDASLPTGWKIKKGINCTYYLRWLLRIEKITCL